LRRDHSADHDAGWAAWVHAASQGRRRQQREGRGVTQPHPRRFTITIDGPAGAGKSTVGAGVAHRLDGVFFDTGILYRAVTLAAQRLGVPPDDARRLARIAADLRVDVSRPSVDDGRLCDIWLDGVDVTWELRTPAVDRAVSEVSAHPAVRAALIEQQRRIGRSGLVVMVGRDIGSVVLPDAELKVYLDASPEERARRRGVQLREAGQPADVAMLLREIVRRDAEDSQRAASPLRVPDGALVIDSDCCSIEQVIDSIAAAARARMRVAR
jgi:cytidylate kinase